MSRHLKTFVASFQGNTLIVRAIRDVRKGDEVFNCYGPHYRRMRRTERLEMLESQYSFVCTCEHCCDTNTEDFQVKTFTDVAIYSNFLFGFRILGRYIFICMSILQWIPCQP